MIAKKTPITIITGFLGSGKTTIIAELLKNPHGKRIAVIVNEFGDVGIDGELIKSSCGCGEDDIVELNNGCLCCTVQEEFLPTMVKLMERKDQIDHIIIETSGLALPKPLLRAVNWPDLKSQVTIDSVITVVDSVGQATGEICDRERVQKQREADDSIDHESTIEELFLDQISCADMVLLTKADLVDADKLVVVQDMLKEKLRDNVKIVNAKKGQFAAEVIFSLHAQAENDIDNRPTLHEKHHDDHDHHHHDHDHVHHHDDDIHSIVVKLGKQIDPDFLMNRIDSLMRDNEIYRIKGFVDVDNKPMRMVIQGVGNRFDKYYDRLWLPEEKRETRLVIIGKDLNEEKITKTINEKLD